MLGGGFDKKVVWSAHAQNVLYSSWLVWGFILYETETDAAVFRCLTGNMFFPLIFCFKRDAWEGRGGSFLFGWKWSDFSSSFFFPTSLQTVFAAFEEVLSVLYHKTKPQCCRNKHYTRVDRWTEKRFQCAAFNVYLHGVQLLHLKCFWLNLVLWLLPRPPLEDRLTGARPSRQESPSP